MSRPPQTTVIFSNFPNDWIVGIDLQFFNTNSILRGIKLIPDGVHIVHFAKDQASIRSGFYINATESQVVILQWDSSSEKMLVNEEIGELNVSKELSKLPEYYPYMINYPKDEYWDNLTEYISWKQLEYILPKNQYIDSVITSTDENNLLMETLKKSAKNRNLANDPIVNSIIDQSDEEIKYSLIDLNETIRPNSTSEEKTKDALDKSWFLEQMLIKNYSSNYRLLLSEFQLSFLNMIIFANYSSSIQWLKILRILLNCAEIVPQQEGLFSAFLDLLYIQFLKFPDEYVDQFIEEDFLKVSISEFDYKLREMNLHKLVKKVISLKSLLSESFGILIQGLVEDDDDLPVVVDF
jgi:A1 cistron-splicing factor AAR2